ncbi:MAG: translesion DNA synthesis-associated protein ImuA [Comamonadaceae bacterium]|nr:MAG: translesion DNA synthesis-associated protein ImuA [Comamonadaceae bacterium]
MATFHSLPVNPVACPQAQGRAVCDVPGVWRGSDWSSDGLTQRTRPSGHALLDAQLPGGGWPLGAMAEVLQPAHAVREWPLVLPGLARAIADGAAGRVVLIAPPHEPFAPALQAAGLPAQRLCRVLAAAHQATEAAWAGEQALRCRDVLAVLAWLPQAQPQTLRRLQLAAAQHGRWLWVFRPDTLREQSSPAPLRLWVQGGGGQLQVRFIKRRGAPLLEPVVLPLRNAGLAAVLDAQARRKRQAQEDADRLLPPSHAPGVVHALDRIAPARR